MPVYCGAENPETEAGKIVGCKLEMPLPLQSNAGRATGDPVG